MKNSIRKKILTDRKSMDRETVITKSSSIIEKLLNTDSYKKAKVIMAYIDFRNEVATEKFIKQAISDGKRIVIPISVVETKELILSELIDYENELISGTYGILEPKPEFIRKTPYELIDMVLVPGVAFDNKGFRVGYGAGYYDRFLDQLSKSVPKIALSFDLQVVDNAHPDDHDFPVDYLITETDVIKCNK